MRNRLCGEDQGEPGSNWIRSNGHMARFHNLYIQLLFLFRNRNFVSAHRTDCSGLGGEGGGGGGGNNNNNGFEFYTCTRTNCCAIVLFKTKLKTYVRLSSRHPAIFIFGTQSVDSRIKFLLIDRIFPRK